MAASALASWHLSCLVRNLITLLERPCREDPTLYGEAGVPLSPVIQPFQDNRCELSCLGPSPKPNPAQPPAEYYQRSPKYLLWRTELPSQALPNVLTQKIMRYNEVVVVLSHHVLRLLVIQQWSNIYEDRYLGPLPGIAPTRSPVLLSPPSGFSLGYIPCSFDTWNTDFSVAPLALILSGQGLVLLCLFSTVHLQVEEQLGHEKCMWQTSECSLMPLVLSSSKNCGMPCQMSCSSLPPRSLE